MVQARYQQTCNEENSDNNDDDDDEAEKVDEEISISVAAVAHICSKPFC